jgi:hypothetical protein
MIEEESQSSLSGIEPSDRHPSGQRDSIHTTPRPTPLQRRKKCELRGSTNQLLLFLDEENLGLGVLIIRCKASNGPIIGSRDELRMDWVIRYTSDNISMETIEFMNLSSSRLDVNDPHCPIL